MFEVEKQTTGFSFNNFVKSILANNYQLEYPQAKDLVKILLESDSLLESVKQELKLDRDFVKKNIDTLNLVCKDSDIAELVARVIDAKSFNFEDFHFLFEQASQSRSEDFVIGLLCYSSDLKLDMKDNRGDTLLHAAAKNGLANACRVLVERGLDVNSEGEYGLRSLHWAARKGYLEVIKVLLELGADVNAKDKYNQTPLHEAAYRERLEVTRLLILSGANVNAKDKLGMTPLHWIAFCGDLEVARLLISYKANVNAKDKHSQTLLHWAAERGYLKAAKVLLERKANVSARDKNGKTPLGQLRKDTWKLLNYCYHMKQM